MVCRLPRRYHLEATQVCLYGIKAPNNSVVAVPLCLLPGDEIVLHQLAVQPAGEESVPGPGQALNAHLHFSRGEDGELEHGGVPGLPDLYSGV